MNRKVGLAAVAGLAAASLCLLSSCGGYDSYAKEQEYLFFHLEEAAAIHCFESKGPYEAGNDYWVLSVIYDGYGNPYDDWSPYAQWIVCNDERTYFDREGILPLLTVWDCPVCG